ncbi:MAG: hypothetical protein J3R72DRAFT_447567 [Linnemannia gamsii]|nr:MAG: hypothetical protein J3R72DRAFT_447567 [Linnemannia gamsii]
MRVRFVHLTPSFLFVFSLIQPSFSISTFLRPIEKITSPPKFWCVPMSGNKLCWMLDQQLAQEQICPEIEDFSQDQQAIHDLCESVRSIPFPCGEEGGGGEDKRQTITLGEIILDSTPSGTPMLLSREEGYFSTWTHGNIALLGDACHKALPYTGQPIAQAGFDAVQLANVLWSKYMDMYADSRRLDASLACSPPGTSSAASISPAVCSHETKQRGEIMIELELGRIEKRLRYHWPCWVYDERRAEAEHAVQQAELDVCMWRRLEEKHVCMHVGRLETCQGVEQSRESCVFLVFEYMPPFFIYFFMRCSCDSCLG